jgi:hypothetical protein
MIGTPATPRTLSEMPAGRYAAGAVAGRPQAGMMKHLVPGILILSLSLPARAQAPYDPYTDGPPPPVPAPVLPPPIYAPARPEDYRGFSPAYPPALVLPAPQATRKGGAKPVPCSEVARKATTRGRNGAPRTITRKAIVCP